MLGSAAASNSVVVTVSDGILSTSVSFSWATASATALPLTASVVGSPGATGNNSFSSGVYTVTGGGAGMAGASDQFRFLSETFTGNGQIIARITSQNNTGPAQAGVMFRETGNANSRFVAMELTPASGFDFQERYNTGEAAYVTAAPSYAAPNNWVRIVRNGSNFTGYVSSNGSTWTQVANYSNPMATVVQIGLVVSSGSSNVLCTATFDNVQITH